MLMSAATILAYRKINFAKMLPNPLGKPKVEDLSKLNSSFEAKSQQKLFIHTVFMMGFGAFVGGIIAR